MTYEEVAALLSKRLGCFVERSVGWTPDGKSNPSNTERFTVHMEWEDLWQFYLDELRAEFATLGYELWAVQDVVCVQDLPPIVLASDLAEMVKEKDDARDRKGSSVYVPIRPSSGVDWV